MPRSMPAWQIAFIGFTILAVSMGIGRFAFTPLLPMMQAEDLVSISEGGFLASVHFAGYVMGALAAVRLTVSPRLLLLVALTAIGLTTAAMGVTDSFPLWMAARWFAGVCSAIVLVLVSTYLARHLSGAVFGQSAVFAGVGGGTALTGIAVLFLADGGHTSMAGWLGFGVLALLVAVPAAARLPIPLFARPAPTSAGPERGRGRYWLLTIPYGAMGGGYIIPATYLPSMAQSLAADPGVYGWGWPVFGLAAMLSTMAAARLYGRWSPRRVWFGSQVVMAFGLVLPVLWPHLAAVILSGVCVGGTFMVITMAGIKEAYRIAGEAHAQTAIAWMTFAFGCGQIISPAVAGWAYDSSGEFSAALLIGALLVLVSLVSLLGPWTNRQQLPKTVAQ